MRQVAVDLQIIPILIGLASDIFTESFTQQGFQ
jgi:hypothetical protein